jgi:polysaccharide biosynthesis/export protein
VTTDSPAWCGRRCLLALLTVALGVTLTAQNQQTRPQRTTTPTVSPDARSATAAAEPFPGYVIGPDDVLSIRFWREDALSAEVTVRSDGHISLPLLNDVSAAGLTPAALRAKLDEAAERYIEDPRATVMVKEIRSRKVFITGMVQEPGAYALNTPMTTLQLIATAKGFKDFADTKDIRIVRGAGSAQTTYKFNYQDIIQGKKPEQNIELLPGDTVVVR